MGESDTTETHSTGKMFPITTCECSPPELDAFIETLNTYPDFSIEILNGDEKPNGKAIVCLNSRTQNPPPIDFWGTYIKNLEKSMQTEQLPRYGSSSFIKKG